jgi:hypothetical protein
MSFDEGTGVTSGISLRSVTAVAAHVPFIEDARAEVTNEMEIMIMAGLATLVSCSASLLFIPSYRLTVDRMLIIIAAESFASCIFFTNCV